MGLAAEAEAEAEAVVAGEAEAEVAAGTEVVQAYRWLPARFPALGAMHA